MSLRKYRWSKVYESSEEELHHFLDAKNIDAIRIMSTESGEAREHASNKESTIWCVEGSLSVRMPDGAVSLQPGDALRIPAGSNYVVTAGLTGYTYYDSAA
jgi:uncharacterized cupin superfamily protein